MQRVSRMRCFWCVPLKIFSYSFCFVAGCLKKQDSQIWSVGKKTWLCADLWKQFVLRELQNKSRRWLRHRSSFKKTEKGTTEHECYLELKTQKFLIPVSWINEFWNLTSFKRALCHLPCTFLVWKMWDWHGLTVWYSVWIVLTRGGNWLWAQKGEDNCVSGVSSPLDIHSLLLLHPYVHIFLKCTLELFSHLLWEKKFKAETMVCTAYKPHAGYYSQWADS